ncbi:MAG: TetR/AcrR family transcriptional regulator [Verrucomicrobiales bacterium]|nr:TetR/AcrR family transcriptional regulator [Verrucomicrobiales bacterium]
MIKRSSARDRILETASQLFQERGYSEVGINEIIDKADTAKATFYQHFPSKESLCTEWLKAVHERSERVRQEILDSDLAPAEKIDRYFVGLGQFLEENDFRGCPYTNTGAVIDEECACIREKIESHKLAIRAFFHKLTAELCPTGRRAKALGDTLFLLFSGATVEGQNLRSLWPVEAARAAAGELCARESDPTAS